MQQQLDPTLELDLELLLPHLPDEKDQCVGKLEQALSTTRGITKAHIEIKDKKTLLCLHYDPAVYSLATLKRTAERAGTEISSRYQHEILKLSGMDCSDCTTVIEHSIRRVDGVLNASVSYVAGTLTIEFDSEKTNLTQLQSRLKALGYEVPESGLSAIVEERRELIFSLICGGSVALAWLALQSPIPLVVVYVLYGLAYLFGGYDIARHAWHSIKERHFDTDFLMIMAAIGAACLGEFLEGGLLLFLFSLGHALEELALDKARDAVGKLGQLTPKSATVVRDSKQVEVSVDDIGIDEIVVVKPGVRIPVDGVIASGSSAVDQSPITGESVPVEKEKGASVYAGSINGNGQLLVRVTRLAKDNTLSRVMQLVEESQAQKTKTQQLTEKFTSWFVPAVVVVDVLLIVVPPLFGLAWQTSFLRAMTFLVSVSPCALALAASSAVLCGIGQAARNGVLIKGGLHLETLGQLKAIAFDKTGTLTHGKPKVTEVVVFTNFDKNQLLSLVAGCESGSGHPLSAAIVKEAELQGLTIPQAEKIDSVVGQGLVAAVDGHAMLVGNRKLMQKHAIEISDKQLQLLTAFEVEGKTAILVAVDGKLAGQIAVADTPRANAQTALSSLRRLGIEHIFLLSGDNATVAKKLAEVLGIDQVKAELMPEDKVTAMKTIAKDRVVAMVGDGVNDAPALAAASVGIAMGGASTDVALETADVALMGDDLSKLAFVISLGRATRHVIIQNLTISIATIVALAATAVVGLSNIGWAIFFHEGSTLLVVVNSLRLLVHRKELTSTALAETKNP